MRPVLSLLPFGVLAAVCAGMFFTGGVSMPAAFLAASVVAFCLKDRPGVSKSGAFAEGMGHKDVMAMCLVFILAGAFASVASATGAVEAMVRLSRHVLPERFAVAGIFAVSCAVSLAIGTSCGTISAVGPVAFGLAVDAGIPLGAMAGALVGGAMFGDNLSMVSDTTIAATRTQGVGMREKFLANVAFATPAALAAFLFYLFSATSTAAATSATLPPPALSASDWVLVCPYVFVLAAALAGMDVMAVLMAGCVLASADGICCGTIGLAEAADAVGRGALSMSETLIVALLAGGLFALAKARGGIDLLTRAAGRLVKGPATCEAAAAALCGATNLFTANNTVAIVVAGPVAAGWRAKFGADPRRMAGILDATGCIVQGLIPYGAQILIATGIAKTFDPAIEPFAILRHMAYPCFLAVAMGVWMLVGALKRDSPSRRG